MNNAITAPFSFKRILFFLLLYFLSAFILVFLEQINPHAASFIDSNFTSFADIINLLLLVWVFTLHKKVTWQSITSLDIKVKKAVVIGIAMIFVQFVLEILVVMLLGGAKVTNDHKAYDADLFTFPKHGNMFVWSLLTVSTICLIAPVFEELFFRGIIFTYLRSKMPVVIALPISAILFGLGHGFTSNILWATMLGVFLGWIYYKTNNIFYSLAGHIFINTFNLMLMILFFSS